VKWLNRITGVAAALAAGFGAQAAHAEVKQPNPKIAFIFFGAISDGGWAGAQDRARLAMQTKFHARIPFVQNVPETTEKVRQAIDLFISRGSNIIIGGSYGYGDAFLAEAKAHPNLAFLNLAGATSADNLESPYARTYEGWYLAGMAAGSATKSNTIGMLEGFPIPNVVWDLNGFALGAKAVNPKVVVKAAYVNSWSDPVKEGQIAKAMIEQGADVIATDMDSAAALVVAEKAGKYSVGYQNDMSASAPNGILTSVMYHWEKRLIPIVEEIKAGTWKSGGVPLYGLATGVSDITKLQHLPPEAVKKIMQARQDIIDGKLYPFEGPVKAQDGTIKVPAGKHPTDDELGKMDYLVDNVQGSMK